jgi:hypothetical protein
MAFDGLWEVWASIVMTALGVELGVYKGAIALIYV